MHMYAHTHTHTHSSSLNLLIWQQTTCPEIIILNAKVNVQVNAEVVVYWPMFLCGADTLVNQLLPPLILKKNFMPLVAKSFVWYLLCHRRTGFSVFLDCWHQFGTEVSVLVTYLVTSQQDGPGFSSLLEVFLCRVCKFFLCLWGKNCGLGCCTRVRPMLLTGSGAEKRRKLQYNTVYCYTLQNNIWEQKDLEI